MRIVTYPRLKLRACPHLQGADRASALGDLMGSMRRLVRAHPRRNAPVACAPLPQRVGNVANIVQDEPGGAPVKPFHQRVWCALAHRTSLPQRRRRRRFPSPAQAGSPHAAIKVVTGGTGFIGSHIVKAYRAQRHPVAVVDNLWPYGGGRRENIFPDVRRSIVDITDFARAEVFERERLDVICHHAAQHSARISTEMPTLDAHVNMLALLNTLENCRIYRTCKLIFACSAATYGAQTSMPLSEETPQSPTSPYGITKVAAGLPSTQRITLETTADDPTL